MFIYSHRFVWHFPLYTMCCSILFASSASFVSLRRFNLELLEVYRLQAGRYELELPDAEGRHPMADMGLFLGVWRGEKEERTGYWLRWWDEEGNLLLWGVERLEQEGLRAEQEHQRAEQERLRAEQERQRADRLAEYLRSQGIDPDQIDR